MSDGILDINIESLTVADIETIEDIVGESIDTAFAEGKPRGKLLRAIGFVVKRRENPEFTIEDAGNLVVKLSDSDPTTAAD
jgi:hypothetical protein